MKELGPGAWKPLTVALVVAAVSGYASIAWLLRFLGRNRLVSFSIYRIALAAVLVGLLASSTLSPFAGV